MDSPVTILLVDDDPHVTELLSLMIKSSNSEWKILTASNGRVALDLIRQEPIDVVISDIQMPEMDGLELMSQARRLLPNLPIFLLTSKVGLYRPELTIEAPNGIVEKLGSLPELLLKVVDSLKKN